MHIIKIVIIAKATLRFMVVSVSSILYFIIAKPKDIGIANDKTVGSINNGFSRKDGR